MQKFNIDKYVNSKISLLKETDKSFKSIYELMFTDKDLVMFEWTDGSRIKKMTYGQCEKEIEAAASSLSQHLKDYKKGSMVGLYAQNSIKWVQVFWAILKCGFIPVLLNTRLEKKRLVESLEPYDIVAIVSDVEKFIYKTINIEDISVDECEEKVDVWANNIAVMSSGTTMDAKLCIYDGECFYYQLLDSAQIIKESKDIKKHYEGSLKQLMFLPLYHIFGLAAMFMWFGFFSRTFVVLKDQSPETILLTIRKHKVTHIFAVPLFWETIYKKFKQTLKTQDEKTQKKANTGLKLVQKLKSTWLGKKLFKPVREKIFGESICFLISGGSSISSEILTFFNSIGYPLANGYGMSEIGISSVELSSRFEDLTDRSVGKPFGHYQYRIDEDGCLYVKGFSMAKEIYVNGKQEILEDGWYRTKDIAKSKNGRYFIVGRLDDMIVGEDGENINPAWFEKQITIEDVNDVCILNINDKPTLLISVSTYKALSHLDEIKMQAQNELIRLGIASVVKNIEFTKEPLIQGNDFKINRRKLAKIKIIDRSEENLDQKQDSELEIQVKKIFAKALGTSEKEIQSKAHFFFDLGGSSLDYFSLLTSIKEEFGVDFPQNENQNLYSVQDFINYIQKFN